MWHVYILECADGTFYAGITTDLQRRVAEHNDPLSRKGAKYTRGRRPVKLVYSRTHKSKIAASRFEWKVKKMSRTKKLAVVKLSTKKLIGN